MTNDAHAVAAALTGLGGISVKAAEFTLDESWSPYAQATVRCAPNAVASAADPRNHVRGQFILRRSFGLPAPLSALSTKWAGKKLSALTAAYAGKRIAAISAENYKPFNLFGLRSSQTRILDLTLRSRTTDARTGEVTLTFASDEALMQDYRLVSASPYEPGYTSVRACVNLALSRIGAALGPGSADGAVAAEASVWRPGVSGWDYVTPLVQAAGLRLWCDERRVWHLEDAQAIQAGQIALATGDSGTITDGTDSINLDGDWYDAVVITYSWTDAAGIQQTRYDTATAPNFQRVLSLEYDTPYPGAGAAAAVLARKQSKGNVMDVSAVADYTASPSTALSITLADGTRQGVAESITWTVPDAAMRVRSRALQVIPPTAWQFVPAGQSWNSQPAGASWNADN